MFLSAIPSSISIDDVDDKQDEDEEPADDLEEAEEINEPDDTSHDEIIASFNKNIEIEKEKVFAEFLRLIGISSVTTQKKERLIKDEVIASQGGTIASRYSRSQPRIKAVKEINAKFGLDISVSYYDGVPTSIEELDNMLGGVEYDMSDI